MKHRLIRRIRKGSAHFLRHGLFWVVAAILAFAAFVFVTCQSRDAYPKVGELIAKNSTVESNKFLLQKLAANRALFFVDSEPGAWRYREGIVDLLDYWSTTEDYQQIPDSLRHLVLILESDSLTVANAQSYMESWDFADFTQVSTTCSANFTTADLEFYWRLGNILHRINGINSRHDSTAQLSLTFLAANDSPTEDSYSHKGYRTDFVELGNLAAKRVCQYSQDNPGVRFLGLFKPQHLRRADYRKNIMAAADSSSHFLVALDSLWQNRESIAVVGCTGLDSWPLYDAELESPSTEYIITDPGASETINQEAAVASCRIDHLMVTSTDDELHLPIIAVPSVNVMKTFIRAMPRLSYASGESQQLYWPPIITYLDGVSGVTPQRVNIQDSRAIGETIHRWQTWADTASTDLVSDITTLQLWYRLLDKITDVQNIVARHYDEELMMLLPDAPRFDGRFGNPTKAERAAQLRVYLSRNRDDIVIRALINILWVGNGSEKTAALESLTRETGMRFSTPSEWSQWYRSGKKEQWQESHF